MVVGARFCLVSFWRISYFGIKFVSGGRSFSERRMSGVRDVSMGVFVYEVARVLMVVDLFSLNIRNVENVIIKYVRRVNSVREGENCKIRII